MQKQDFKGLGNLCTAGPIVPVTVEKLPNPQATHHWNRFPSEVLSPLNPDAWVWGQRIFTSLFTVRGFLQKLPCWPLDLIALTLTWVKGFRLKTNKCQTSQLPSRDPKMVFHYWVTVAKSQMYSLGLHSSSILCSSNHCFLGTCEMLGAEDMRKRTAPLPQDTNVAFVPHPEAHQEMVCTGQRLTASPCLQEFSSHGLPHPLL